MKTFQDQKFVKFLESYSKGDLSEDQEMVRNQSLKFLVYI